MQDYTGIAVIDEFAAAREQFELVLTELTTERAQGMEFAAAERLVQTEGYELLRRILQGYLKLRSREEQREASVVGPDGVERTHCREKQSRQLMTVFGEVVVTRMGYSGRGIESHFPLDAALNVPKEKYSPGLRERVAIEAAKGSFDEVVAAIDQNTGGKVPKRQAEELSRAISQDFDAFYEAKQAPPPGKGLLVMSVDGKGIVVRPDDLRPATRKAAQGAKHKLATRLSRGEKRNRKRMATVATVYEIEPHMRSAEIILGRVEPPPGEARPKPLSKRVWASVRQELGEVIEEVFQEALRRDPLKEQQWLMLVDGHETQLRLVYEAIERHQAPVIVIQDFVHVLEYVWKAAYCFYPDGSPEAEKWVLERALGILSGKVSDVAAGMRRSATRRNLSQDARVPVDKCASYLLKNRGRLDFATALQHGWPIATGVIEGACRHLVKDRMDITGARWSLDGAEAVLRLRSLRSSGDFEDYMQFHQDQERLRNYAPAA